MYIRVHAIPGARRESVTKKNDTEFYISVRENAERNMANRRIRMLLAEALDVPAAQIRMLTGHRSSTKIYSVEER